MHADRPSPHCTLILANSKRGTELKYIPVGAVILLATTRLGVAQPATDKKYMLDIADRIFPGINIQLTNV